MFNDVPDDVRWAYNYLYELGKKTSCSKLTNIAYKLYVVSKDRDYWKRRNENNI